jgi:redox-sensitive bicupin YhaK (pirin superfamily)
VLSHDADENDVQLSATQDGTELVLIAGEPLDQNVVQYGPFIMTSNTEITKTIMDCEC